MFRLTFAIALLVLAPAGVQAADCVPLASAQASAKSEGLGVLWSGDTISIDESTGNQVTTTASVQMTVREKLEARLRSNLNATDTAARAVRNGAIPPGDEAKFISALREMSYLELKQYRAGFVWVALMANIDQHKGVVFRRSYEFPDEGRSGSMRGADSVCTQARLEALSLWPAAQAATAAALLKRPERADCRSLADTGFPCASLSRQLELAEKNGEAVYATARDDRDFLVVFTVSKATGRGRVLFVRADGTALLFDRATNIKTSI